MIVQPTSTVSTTHITDTQHYRHHHQQHHQHSHKFKPPAQLTFNSSLRVPQTLRVLPASTSFVTFPSTVLSSHICFQSNPKNKPHYSQSFVPLQPAQLKRSSAGGSDHPPSAPHLVAGATFRECSVSDVCLRNAPITMQTVCAKDTTVTRTWRGTIVVVKLLIYHYTRTT